MSAPAVPLCDAEGFEFADAGGEPLTCGYDDAPGLSPDPPTVDGFDLEDVDAVLRHSVKVRLEAVAAIAEAQYTCEVAHMILERLGGGRRPRVRRR
jgi:hypothetical protein